MNRRDFISIVIVVVATASVCGLIVDTPQAVATMSADAWWVTAIAVITFITILYVWRLPDNGRRLVEKRRATGRFGECLDALIEGAPDGHEPKESSEWVDGVLEVFRTWLIKPRPVVAEFQRKTAGIKEGKNIREAVVGGKEYLKDLKGMVKASNLKHLS
jgi:hypothetical protein